MLAKVGQAVGPRSLEKTVELHRQLKIALGRLRRGDDRVDVSPQPGHRLLEVHQLRLVTLVQRVPHTRVPLQRLVVRRPLCVVACLETRTGGLV